MDSSSEASSGDTQSTEGRSASQDDDALVTKQPPRATVAVTSSWPVYSVWIGNRSAKVFHRFKSLSEPTGDSIHNRVTVCGRKVLDRFDRCGDPARFDSICKICVKTRLCGGNVPSGAGLCPRGNGPREAKHVGKKNEHGNVPRMCGQTRMSFSL